MDTTGHLVTIAAYLLDRHPELKARMMEEIKANYPLDRPVTIEELNKLEFTMAFLKEALRTNTPVPGAIIRRAARDHKLGEFKIREGDIVNVDYFYNNFNEEYFTDSETFNPNRWLTKGKVIDSYAFTPFGAGQRNCIGQHLALIEARIILAEFLMMYDFSIDKDYTLKMDFKFLYEAVDPIKVDLTLKKTQ